MRGAVLLTVAALAAPAGAQEGCWLLCTEELVLVGPEAAAQLEGWLGGALPPRTKVLDYEEDGFQDAIVWARLETDAAGLRDLLDWIEAYPLTPEFPESVGKSAEDPDWWDWRVRSGVKFAEGGLPLLPFVTLRAAAAPGAPGRWTVWLVGFQT